MTLLDMDKIEQSLTFPIRHYRVFLLLALVQGVLQSPLTTIQTSFSNDMLFTFLFLPLNFFLGVLWFSVSFYLMYQLYHQRPFVLAEVLQVHRQRFWHTCGIYLRFLLVVFFYTFAATLPVFFAAEASPYIGFVVAIPLFILFIKAITPYTLVLYFGFFEHALPYNAVRAKSFAYVKPRLWCVVVSLMLLFVIGGIVSGSIIQMLIAPLGEGLVSSFFSSVVAFLLLLPCGVLGFLFFLDAKALDDNGELNTEEPAAKTAAK